jgi:hypothetical protein
MILLIFLLSLALGIVLLATPVSDFFIENHPALLWFLSMSLFLIAYLSLIASFVEKHYTDYYPVQYKLVINSSKITAVTDYGCFSSEKKKDFDEWQTAEKGYIKVVRNFYGSELNKTFTVAKENE